MLKIMICLKRPENEAAAPWNNRVKKWIIANEGEYAAASYAVKDEDVSPAHLLELKYTKHPSDAVISIWRENPYHLDELFRTAKDVGEYQAYAVIESTAIEHTMKVGRVPGMCQIAFIKKPKDQCRQEWHDAWLGDHTQTAIDTQSNFAYRQNVIGMSLPLKSNCEMTWPLMDAIVEENFPVEAMTSREVFFDAKGDPEKFERHQQIMLQSCVRFIDFECFDCVPMSQYIVKT